MLRSLSDLTDKEFETRHAQSKRQAQELIEREDTQSFNSLANDTEAILAGFRRLEQMIATGAA